MADSRIILISEKAPRLESLDTEDVRKFLRDYFSYQNRVDESEVVSPLRALIDPHDKDTLKACFYEEGWCRLISRKPTAEVSARDRRRAELQTPMTPSVLASSFDEEAEAFSLLKPEKKGSVKFESVGSEKKAEEGLKEELKSSVRLEAALPSSSVVGEAITDLADPLQAVVGGDSSGLPNVVPNSNAHMELMLVQLVGPRRVDEAVDLMRALKMSKDSQKVSFAVAADYVRRWREEARWCRHYLPTQKTMIKAFVDGVYPKRLGESLRNEDCKTMSQCLPSFLAKYQEYADARRTAHYYDGGEAPRKDEKGKQGKGETPKESKATPKTPNPKSTAKTKDRSSIVCYHCGERGHIKPNCPQRKEAAAAAAPPKKLGALSL